MAENLLAKYGTVQAAPRNNLLGLIADALGKADAYANKPDKSMPGGVANPPLSMLANMLGVGAIARTADRASYGHDLTQGKGWARQMLPDTKEAVLSLMPGSVAKPGAALGVAGLLGGGAVDGSARAIFAGVKAKTADHAALAAAEKMAAAGADPRKVWTETGWFKGADGKWRFEIDDSKANFIDRFKKPTADQFLAQEEARKTIAAIKADKQAAREAGAYTVPGFYGARPGVYDRENAARGVLSEYESKFANPLPKHGPLGDFVDHDALDSAYPDLADIATTHNKSYSGGAYMPGPNTLLVGGGDERSVALHELQHAVQSREGFAAGGSPTQFAGVASAAQAELDKINGILNSGKYDMKEYQSLLQRKREILNSSTEAELSPYEQYRRLAGEAEARAVEARMNFTPAQRRALFPLDSYDVPINQLIVRP